MSRTNTKTRRPAARVVATKTHEGAPAHFSTAERELRRAVLSCFLWEDSFYESGVEIATRIQTLASKIEPEKVAALAVEARHVMHLRHVSLLLLVALAKTASGIPHLLADTIEKVVSRPDELGELVALYWKANGKDKPLSAQLKKGLAKAVTKFDQYQLTKWNKDSDVRIRDVVFLTHPRTFELATGQVLARLVNKDHYPTKTKAGFRVKTHYGSWEKLAPPDTWEVELSAEGNNSETWTRLLSERKLGYLALLRNLRNMSQVSVDTTLVKTAIRERRGAHNVFPFRFIAAAKYAPMFEDALNDALLASVAELPTLRGKTAVLVDVSGSMDDKLSGKSDLRRVDAAAALAAIVPAEDLRVFTFSNYIKEVAPRRGIPGIETIVNSQSHGGTDLGGAIRHLNNLGFDRVIVITDEQSHTPVPPSAAGRAYMVNVAGYRPSVAYEKDWVKIEGFSENILRYIAELEKFGTR